MADRKKHEIYEEQKKQMLVKTYYGEAVCWRHKVNKTWHPHGVCSSQGVQTRKSTVTVTVGQLLGWETLEAMGAHR